jgi:hypothetical protein
MRYLRELDQSTWFIPATSLFLYAVACALPCLEYETFAGEREIWYGYAILLEGWMAILVGQVAWLANPLWLLAMLFFVFRRWSLALTCALGGLLLAGSALLLFRQNVVLDIGGGIIPQQRPLIGVPVWLLSQLVLFIGAVLMRHRQRVAGPR